MTNPQSLFIGLRAEGKSFSAIAQELKVSKPTLIHWSKLFENEIKDLQAFRVKNYRQKVLMNQRPAEGSGSAS